MDESNTLIDEFEKLQLFKKDLEIQEEILRNKIIELAKQKNQDILFGTNKKCSVKQYQKVIYPQDKTELVKLIKEKGLYEMFSSVNYLKLGPAIIKGQVDKEISIMTKIENAFRLSLLNL